MNNEKRASAARKALLAFCSEMERLVSGDSRYQEKNGIADLLSGFMHLCNRDGLSFKAALASGQFGYRRELAAEKFDKREVAVRDAGWTLGGDEPQFWFHEPTWGSWKAAASWEGSDNEPNGPDTHPTTYGTLEELLKGEEF